MRGTLFFSRHSITTERQFIVGISSCFRGRCVNDEQATLCLTTAKFDPTGNASRTSVPDRDPVPRWVRRRGTIHDVAVWRSIVSSLALIRMIGGGKRCNNEKNTERTEAMVAMEE